MGDTFHVESSSQPVSTTVIPTPTRGRDSLNADNATALLESGSESKSASVFCFVDFPSEIIVIILSDVYANDLLDLSRASKALRQFLLDRSARPLWTNALKNLGPMLPQCPEDMTEPHFTHCIFGTYCHVSVPLAPLFKVNTKATRDKLLREARLEQPDIWCCRKAQYFKEFVPIIECVLRGGGLDPATATHEELRTMKGTSFECGHVACYQPEQRLVAQKLYSAVDAIRHWAKHYGEHQKRCYQEHEEADWELIERLAPNAPTFLIPVADKYAWHGLGLCGW